ncbi:MAG: paraquat-inducible protein A [Thiovulaceae bacterium]|nr:paraquat-inducible protein A [Sulfurimonadaceae bacterium]
MNWKTDINTGKVLCLLCDKLHDADKTVCSRCGGHLHQRRPFALLRTFNFSLVAIFFLIPANLLPIMHVTSLGTVESRTIMDGIVHFFSTGSYFIGSVVFIASIAVPFIKLSVLLYLIYIAKFEKYQQAMQGIKYYRMINLIGKWSMLDVFVIALMVAMVQFQKIATINTGPAAISFTVAVIATIIATKSFDPRQLWRNSSL